MASISGETAGSLSLRELKISLEVIVVGAVDSVEILGRPRI
jgi:hypothetical protein